jgi:methenyltetrahydrofolate cyclohydrolase
MMKLTDRTIAEFLAAVRSSEPTPGGGSASALAGAVGASLLAMVAAVPKPRATTDEDLGRLHAAGARCAELSEVLTALIDRDSDAYNGVMAAYRLPRQTGEEKAARSGRIQEALRAATDAPLDVMRACRDAIRQAAAVAAHGNPNASSDVQVALELLGAGLRGAQMNVEINLPNVKDEAYVARTRSDVERLAADANAGTAAARTGLSEAR